MSNKRGDGVRNRVGSALWSRLFWSRTSDKLSCAPQWLGGKSRRRSLILLPKVSWCGVSRKLRHPTDVWSLFAASAKQPCNCRLVIATANSHWAPRCTPASQCENARKNDVVFKSNWENPFSDHARPQEFRRWTRSHKSNDHTFFPHKPKTVKTLGPQRANKVRLFFVFLRV